VDAADDRAGRPGAEENAMNEEPAVTLALRRAAIYRVLAQAFAYPTAPGLEAVAVAAWNAAVVAPAGLRVLLRRLADAAAGGDEAGLAAEHVTLFTRQVRCPPYEGAYGPASMAGKATLLADVAGFYAAFGLEPAAGRPEVEDHVCAELEFMSALALKEAWALTEGHAGGLVVTRDAQRAFLAEHLARWSPGFAARLAETATPGFYPAAAALLQAWLADECARLALTVRPLEGIDEAEAAPLTCPMALATEPDA
jgi:DMSO reductase family type II enzyme chaperone